MSDIVDGTSTLLIVDDEPVSMTMLVDLFRLSGYQVLSAATAQEALEAVKQNIPDLILLEVMLPDMDGFALCRLLKADVTVTDVPVIFLSAMSESADRLTGLSAGAVDFINKPFDVREAIVRVSQHVTLRRLRKELQKRNADLEAEIAERMQAEESLRASTQKLKQQNIELRKLWQAVQQSANTIVITDAQGKIEYVNPRFVETTGYSIEEALGQNPRILNSGEHSELYYRHLWQMILSGQIWRGEFHNRRKDGSLYWEEAAIAPVYNDGGVIVSFIATKEDITARKETEEILRQRTDQLDMLRKMALELSAQLEMDTVLRSIVRRAVRLLGASSGGLYLYQPAQDGLELAAFRGEKQLEQSFLPRGEGVGGRILVTARSLAIEDYSLWERRLSAEQDTLGSSVVGAPIYWGSELLGVVSVWRDRVAPFIDSEIDLLEMFAAHAAIVIQNARLYEQTQADMLDLLNLNGELQARNEELDAFAHTVAHDLKNPLAVLVSGAALLSEAYEDLSPDQAQGLLASIVSGGEKMTAIVEGLLLLVGVRKQKVNPEPLDMGMIIQGALGRMMNIIRENKAQVILPDSSSWPRALGYVQWVEEVWYNYLSNGLRYGGQPPRIEVGAQVEGGMVRFWVHDNGKGLSEEEQARLFVPFERLGQVGTKGHGLGLSIVRRIVERLGGQVGIESRLDQGSTFFFTLPEAKS